MATALDWTARKVNRVLAALELKGLATRSPERVPRYLPAPADIAIEALILKRQGELQRARLTASLLHEQSLRGGNARKSEQRVVELESRGGDVATEDALRVARADLGVRRHFIATLEACEASGRWCPPRLDDPHPASRRARRERASPRAPAA